MRILLIRHGETDWNRQGRFQGREDIPLNETGIEQARLCGEALKGEHFAAVITSPLKRAKRTGEIIASCVECNNIIVEDTIIERNFAKISGMTYEERDAFYASGQDDEKEPWDVLCNRVMKALAKYAKKYPRDSIIMVSHGATINAALSILSGGEIGSRKTKLKNACISILYCENGHIELGPYNLTGEEYLDIKGTN